jgi:polyphosphate kinase 2 (PPK2 family)
MFRTAELGRSVPKKEFREREATLREELLGAQQELRKVRRFPVILVFAGVDGAGKGETVNLLNEWMDPRWLVTRAYGEPSDEESERPEYWRYWRDLPPKGRVGMFLSSWYSHPVLDKVFKRIDLAQLDERLDRIIAFENALIDDGAVIVKFWMHLSKAAQKARFKTLEKDPLLRWRVTERDWSHWRMYDQFLEAAERAIMRTSTGKAPWMIVEGADHNYRSLLVGARVRDAIRRRLEDVGVEDRLKVELRERHLAETRESGQTGAAEASGKGGEDGADMAQTTPPLTVLDTLDMSQTLEKKEYREQIKRWHAKLNQRHRKALQKKISTLLVFEGWDAAGKGGAIRRLTAAMDARNYQVLPFAAPSDEERAQHYLWRFWRNLSRAGRFTIFDRSWYGRVLVERVEGFATEEEWCRAYAEINDFEAQLIEHGMVLLKFWLHITPEEQLERFRSREHTPYKRWKLTREDWRNREKWGLYGSAVHDMVERTSTRLAPWILVEGNDKLFARAKVLRSVCDKLGQTLGPEDSSLKP